MAESSLKPRLPRGVKGAAKGGAAPSARWATDEEITADAWAYRPGRLLLGRHKGQWIGTDDNRHVLTVAGSRAVKSTTALMPALLTWQGSALVIDPKAEIAAHTAERRFREHDQQVVVLDPFGTASDWLEATAAFNPLDAFDPDNADAIDDAAVIADALILQETGTGAHWTQSARVLLRGLILHVATAEPTETRHLVQLRRMLTQDWHGTLAAMSDSTARNEAVRGIITGTAHSLAGMDEREQSGVLSTVRVQTEFLDSPAMERVLTRSDFDLGDLKRQKLSVYLCLPAGRMPTHSRWLRLFVNLALVALERERAVPDPPVLFVLEEFPQLGHMQILEKAAGLVAGFGVKLWTVLQDLTQLKAHYPNSWETFIGNAGIVQAFGNADGTTCEYVSKLLGVLPITETVHLPRTATGIGAGQPDESDSIREVPLLAPFEVARDFSREMRRQIVIRPGHTPLDIERMHWRNV